MSLSSNPGSSSSASGNPGLKIARPAPGLPAQLLQGYADRLLDGDRTGAKRLIDGCLKNGLTPEQLLTDLVWTVMERVQSDYRSDSLSVTQLNLATRLNRSIADALGAKLEPAPANGRRVLLFCGNAEPEELGGQITADLFEAAGYEVKFAGGGVPDDEVLKLIGDYRPELLVMFATLPQQVPAVRKLIDYLREINSNPEMQVMCCGGIYKRADGLAEEIGADLYAGDGAAAVEVALRSEGRRATLEQQTVGRKIRIRKQQLQTQRRGPVAGRIAPRPMDDEGRREAV